MAKIFRNTFIILFAFFYGGTQTIVGQEKQPETGLPCPGWKEGELDIHHIYTGRGESNFFILPDGKSMLIDAGDYDRQDYLLMTPALSDTTRQAVEWIARYIERGNPHKDHANYFFLSHFHDDHFGEVRSSMQMTTGRDTDYILSGIGEVAEHIHFDKLVDSSYPYYDFPRENHNDIHLRNYRNLKFGIWFQMESFGPVMECVWIPWSVTCVWGKQTAEKNGHMHSESATARRPLRRVASNYQLR